MTASPMQTRPVIRLGISPCPNDTFAFYHLLEKRRDLPFTIELIMADVEELNRRVTDHRFEISKVSFHLFAHVAADYLLLDTGSALGRGCGPLLLCRQGKDFDEAAKGVTAIPGKYTTAAMLFGMFMADRGITAPETVEMNFAHIPDAVAAGEVNAGVVIHESRFTYMEKGLSCVQDLGQWWEDTTGMPIPLGGIIAKKGMNREIVRFFDRALRESIRYALANMDEALEFCSLHAQEMSPEVMRKHIGLYVNSFTEDLGEEGRNAVRFMFEHGARHRLFPMIHPEFAGG